MAETLYHITKIERWENALINGEYRPKQFLDDGFIHCCYNQLR